MRFRDGTVPHRRQRAAGEIWPAQAGARRADRAAADRPAARAAQRCARPDQRAAAAQPERRRASTIAPAGGSKLGPFTSNGQILLPKGAPTVIAIAALDAGDAHASGRLRSDPGGFTGRLNLAGAALSGTLDFAPVGGAQKIDAHLIADQRRSARRCRSAAARSTGRSSSTTTAPRSTARSTRAGSSLRRAQPRPAHRQRQAGQRQRARSARPSPAGAARPSPSSTLADVSPDRISITRQGPKSNAARSVLKQPAVLTRAGDGWALAPTSLTFAGGSAVVSGRSGSRPEVHAQLSARCRSRCSTSSGPGLDLSGSATGRLDYAWKGNRSGRLDLKVRGLSRAGLVLASQADRRRHRRGDQRRQRGGARGRGQRRQDRRPGAGALRADGQRAAGRRTAQRAVVRAASLYRRRRTPCGG